MIHHPRRVGSLRVSLQQWHRARKCPVCDDLTRVLVVARTPSASAYGYCPGCWAVSEAAYARWRRCASVGARRPSVGA